MINKSLEYLQSDSSRYLTNGRNFLMLIDLSFVLSVRPEQKLSTASQRSSCQKPLVDVREIIRNLRYVHFGL